MSADTIAGIGCLAVVAALTVHAAVRGLVPWVRRWRRDLRDMRLFRAAIHDPEGRRIVQPIIDRLTLIVLDQELDDRTGRSDREDQPR